MTRFFAGAREFVNADKIKMRNTVFEEQLFRQHLKKVAHVSVGWMVVGVGWMVKASNLKLK